jgi:hypothetical protein
MESIALEVAKVATLPDRARSLATSVLFELKKIGTG